MNGFSPNNIAASAKGGIRLPNEILARIFLEVAPLELVKCRRVCRRFRCLIDDTPSLQYGLECALAGVVPVPSKRHGLQSALDNLRKWRESSIALDQTDDYELPFTYATGAERLPGSNTVVARTCVAQVHPQKDILITQLRSRYRGISPKQWTVKPRSESTPLFFEMDQAQDLFAVVEMIVVGDVLLGFKIDSFSLTTGERHPLGSRRTIKADVSPVTADAQVRLSISNDHLGLVLFGNRRPASHSEIWVWNWKTGECKLNAYGLGEDGELNASSLIFLDEMHVLVPSWVPLGRFHQPDKLGLRILSYNPGSKERKEYEKVDAVAELKLPELGRRICLLQFDGAGNPWSSQPPSPDFDVPFDTSMHSRIFVFNIVLASIDYHVPVYYTLFAPMDLFRRCCSAPLSTIIDWESWSSDARMIRKVPSGIISDGHVFQTRALFPEYYTGPDKDTNDASRDPTFVIYDFSCPAALRRDAASNKFTNCEYIFEPTRLPNDERAWRHQIVTGEALPFRKIWTGITLSLQSAMFSLVEDCLIVGEEGGTSWRIKQF